MGLRSQNNPIASFRDVFSATGKDAVTAPSGAASSGITATGGVISDYTEGNTVYRAHIFTSTGELDVTAIGALPAEADFVVVGGGGAGGSDPANNGAAGGGGAGGYRTSMPEGPGGPSPSAESKITLSAQSYTITVGGGGAATGSTGVPGSPGSPSTFSTITSQGGGGGGAAYVSTAPWNGDGRGGGSGGGAASQNTTSQVAGAGSRVTDPDGPAPNQGYPGGLGHSSGTGTNTQRSGGGGGASSAGIPATSGTSANGGGGSGKTSTITGTSTNYAGGGTACNDSNFVPASNNPGSPYGGGSSADLSNANYDGARGAFGTGGGGCGNGWDGHPSPYALGGDGGSGFVVVRYQIGQLTATAKATGGAISFYNGKTIHVFTGTGSLSSDNPFNETCECIIIGGGAGSGNPATSGAHGPGGGGAGAVYDRNNVALNLSGPWTFNVQVGGGGSRGEGTKGSNGSPSAVAFPTGTLTAPGGGAGGVSVPAQIDGNPGGAGGGASNYSPPDGTGGVGDGDPWTPGTPGNDPGSGWGGNGGTSTAIAGVYGGGGGGGAINGQNGSGNKGGDGGGGYKIPTTYQDPAATYGYNGPGSTHFWFAGGGGGGIYEQTSGNEGIGGGGPDLNTPYAGAGNGGWRATDGSGIGTPALANSGSGAGGGGGGNADPGAIGGSGIVIIAYPS